MTVNIMQTTQDMIRDFFFTFLYIFHDTQKPSNLQATATVQQNHFKMPSFRDLKANLSMAFTGDYKE